MTTFIWAASFSFQENGNEASEVSICNIFRFYPRVKNADNTKENAQTEHTPGGKGYISNRKQRLINNSGKLLIPYSKIKTIHLWKLKTGTDMELNIFDSNSEELLKWYLSLMKFAPHIFTTFKVKVFLKNETQDEFEKRLLLWQKEYMIPSDVSGKISIFYIT